MKHFKTLNLVSLVLVCTLLSGCFGSSAKQAYITIQVFDPNPQAVTRELFLRETNGKQQSMLLLLTSTEVNLALPAGTWDLWVWSRDSQGRVLGEGSESRILGAKSSYVAVSVKSIVNAPVPPQITKVWWERDLLNWEIRGSSYNNDVWQIWRSSDGKRWFMLGETTGANLAFRVSALDQENYYYGVRYADPRPGSFAGPLVVSARPPRGGIAITWEFEYNFPIAQSRALDFDPRAFEFSSEPEFTDLVVHFLSSTAYARRAELLGALGLNIKSEQPLLELVLAEPSATSELSLAEWSTYAGADFFVEPNWLVQATGFASSLGSSVPAYLQAMRVPQAQDATSWRGDVVVAVLDTGLNANALPSGTKVLPGYNFINSSTNISDNHNNIHGTQVSKVITEIAPHVRILPVKVMDQNGRGSAYQIAQGILYAAGINQSPQNPNQAQIINLSLGQIPPSEVLERAVRQASNSALVVAAAGNADLGESAYGLYYPAAYSEVIAVGTVFLAATGPVRREYSHYGPGLAVVSPEWSQKGTSFSAPMVSGVIALMLGNGVSATQARSILTTTASDLGAPGWDEHYGYGLVNAEWAVTESTSLELSLFDLENRELVASKRVNLKSLSASFLVAPGDYLLKAKLNNFEASERVFVEPDFGQNIHLLLKEY